MFARLKEFDWAVFVSPGAIAAARPAFPASWPLEVGIAVVGPGSVQALREAGIDTRVVRCVSPAGAPYDADALMRLAPFDAPDGARVLVVAGNRGRSDWIGALGDRGARVSRLRVYRNEACAPDPAALALVAEWAGRRDPASFVFTSLDAVAALARLDAARSWWPWASKQPALAPHSRIATALTAAGWVEARTIEPGEQALFAALESS